MSTAPQTSTTSGGKKTDFGRLLFAAGGVALIVLAVAAYFYANRYEVLATNYGRRRGVEHAKSVNGTAVLGQMFAKSGHKVGSVSRLSPRVQKASVIVWAPLDFQLPSEEARDFFRDWLANHAGQKLIYIGRDFDAAIRYWENVRASAAEDQLGRIERELAFAEGKYQQERVKTPDDLNVEWFETHVHQPPHQVQQLTGPWAAGIDASKTEIVLETRLSIPKPSKTTATKPPVPAIVVGPNASSKSTPAPVFPPLPAAATRPPVAMNYEVLLQGDGEPLITRATYQDKSPGEILIVQNGSFLLNYPLVNHEHRKLAGKLIEECGPPTQVVFLESSSSPDISEDIPEADSNPFRVLTVWPINALLLHATIVGILYCFSLAPIFGRPRTLLAESLADFGQHVAALGKLLARGKDRDYAQQRLHSYRQQVQSSKGHGRLRATDDHGKHAPKT